MLNMKRLSWGAVLAAAFLVLGCSGADGQNGQQGPPGSQGDPGKQGPPGDAGVVPPLTNDVSGTVTSDGTTPLAGRHRDRRRPAPPTTTTDATGAFSFKSLAVGAYEMTFHLAGYVDQTITVAVNLSGPTTVSVVMPFNLDGAVGPTVAVSDQLERRASTRRSPSRPPPPATGTLTYAWTQTGGAPVTLTGASTATLHASPPPTS